MSAVQELRVHLPSGSPEDSRPQGSGAPVPPFLGHLQLETLQRARCPRGGSVSSPLSRLCLRSCFREPCHLTAAAAAGASGPTFWRQSRPEVPLASLGK